MTDTPKDKLAAVPPLEPPDVAEPVQLRKRSGTPGSVRRRRAREDDAAPASAKPAPPKRTTAKLEDRLTGSLVMVGMGVAVLNHDDGMAVMRGAPALAAAMVKLGDENPKVRKALEAAVSASAWGEVLAASLAIAVPIAANHGALPPGALAMFSTGEGDPVGPTPVTVPTAAAFPNGAYPPFHSV